MTTHALASAIPFARPPIPQRRSRSPWAPAADGPYKLPREIEERLTGSLAAYRNREAAFRLAVFLGRFWSSPRRLISAFPIDRRALAAHAALGLTEARVRGAIVALEEIGFLEREEPAAGKRYQRTEEGLHRRPIAFRFGSEYGASFGKANGRAQAARGGSSPSRRPLPPATPPRPPTALFEPRSQVAQKQSSPERGLIMGEKNPAKPESGLEAALARLRRGIGL